MTEKQEKAKEWLSKASTAKTMAAEMWDRAMELNSQMTNMVLPLEGERVSTSPSSDKMVDAIIKFMELKDEYLVLYTKYLEMEQEFTRVTEEVLDDIEKQIIRRRFLERIPFYDIAAGLDYSERQTFRIYLNALDKIADVEDMSVNVSL